MRYDSYESKIVKIANIFKFIFKHKIKIMISMAVMLTTTVTLLATKGIIVGAKECPDEILYGETLEYSPGAFISDINYEYSSDAENWTSEHPILPGSYYVRAVSNASFGERYGEPQSFRILPKPIEVKIKNTNVEYGKLPEISAELEYGDVLSCDGFIYSPSENAGTKNVTPDMRNLKLTDKNGLDVSFCYQITPVTLQMTVVPREVNLTVHDSSKIYDGLPLTPSGYTWSEGTLVGGDRYEVTLTGSQTDAGISKAGAVYAFYDKDGKNVSDLYKVSLKEGSLTVSQREITLSTESFSKVYDAANLALEKYTADGTLAEGQKIEALGWKSITDVGEIENSFEAKILDAAGTDFTKNYKITYKFGTLTVTKRPVTITTASQSFTYDGAEHYYADEYIFAFGVEGNEFSGLCEGHSIAAASGCTFKEVADSGVNNIQFEIMCGNTAIDKENYEIDYKPGSVTVSKRPIVINTGSHSFTYDAKEHPYGIEDIWGLPLENVESSGLCIGHEISVTANKVFLNVPDSGKNDIQFEIKCGDEVIDKNNYEIINKYGDVTISPIAISVASPHHLLSYDGKEHKGISSVSDVTLTQGALIEGHSIKLVEESVTIIKDVVSEDDNRFKIEILDDKGEPINFNYAVTYDYGKITVTPPSLTVNMRTESHVYNGKDRVIGYSDVIGLVDGHKLKVFAMTSEKNVGTYVNTITEYDILDENENSVKHNYPTVVINDGTLTITKRKVMLITADAEKTYDKAPLFTEEWVCAAGNPDWSYYSLADGHSVYAVGTYTQLTNAGTAENVFTGDVYINDESGKDATSNYEVETGHGTLTVKRRPVTVVTVSDEFFYDNTDHGYGSNTEDVKVKDGDPYGLCEGHYLAIQNTTVFKNVSDSGNNLLNAIVVNEEINANYILTHEYGYVNVKPRPVTVVTVSDAFVYDGKEHVYGNDASHVKVKDGDPFGLCEGHYLVITGTTVFKNATLTAYDELNQIPFVVVDEDIHKNYLITSEYGKVAVSKRPIKISTKDHKFVYDGKTHEYGLDDITAEAYNPENNSGLCEGHYIYVTNTSKFTNVSDSGNNVIGYGFRTDAELIESYNYEPDFKPGTVTVDKRPIAISTTGDAFVYDGKTHEYGDGYITAEPYGAEKTTGLCEGHYIYVTETAKFTNVSDSGDNAIKYGFRTDWGLIDSNNYQPTETFAKVTVSKRPLTVTTHDHTFMYDGKVNEFGYGYITAEAYDSENNSGLCEGHAIVVTSPSKFKNVADSGTNVIGYEISNGYTNINKENYAITDVHGAVTVTKRPITVISQSYEGPYDGNEININGVYSSDTEGYGLCDGHTFTSEDKFYKDIVYNAENDVEFDILDEYLVSAKVNYEITYIKGKVTIYPRDICVITASQKWEYDGKEHSDLSFKFDLKNNVNHMLYGHELVVVSGTVIKDVGILENTLVFKVIDSATLADVTHLYGINQTKGTLEVFEDTNPDDNITPEPILPDNPGIGLPLPGEDGDGDGEDEVIFVISSDYSGLVYLKQGSYGDYTGKGWNKAQEYSDLLLGYASASYLSSMAAKNAGLPTATILIESKHGIYVLPYYAQPKYGIQISDTLVSGDATKPYTINYYPNINGAYLGDNLKTYEEAYRQFVYGEYLEIDAETLNFMNEIISKEGLSANDVYAVADYIMSAAKYDLKYDRALDDENNIVTAFLGEYKSGVCQHYASAATMLYRALGIPARYTLGYVAEAESGVAVDVTKSQAHAWVEIYLDGIGWMQIEVTGGGSGGGIIGGGNGGGGGEEEEEPYLAYEKITVRPLNQSKEYDSYPLYPSNKADESDEILRQLLAYGYSYSLKATGSQTEVGIGTSYVESFHIYDQYGNDITSYYTINYETGALRVSHAIIEIYIYEKLFEYSSETYSISNDEYFVTKIRDDLTVEISNINISITDAGWINSEDINRNPEKYFTYKVLTTDGVDVTDLCMIKVASYPGGGQYDVITVKKRQITVATASETKEYDEDTPLTNKGYFMSYGTLGEGHTLYVEVTGSKTGIGSAPNTVNGSATKIVDANGVDRTKNYSISWELGQLTVVN